MNDTTSVWDWANSTVPGEVKVKVDTLYSAAKQVADVYDEQTARTFLTGSSPFLADHSVLEFTAYAGVEEDAIEMVDGAVDAFLN